MGQKTKNNARTRKGKRKTVANKKKGCQIVARGLILWHKKRKDKAKKRVVVVEPVGQAHIRASFNNIIISLTNNNGQVISWASAGKMGFKGSKKNTPYAAQMAAEDCAKKAHDLGLRKVEVFVKGPGAGT